MSIHTPQAEVDAWEAVATADYIDPIVGDNEVSETLKKSAIMRLEYYASLRDQVSETRVGGKTKNTPQSSTPSLDFLAGRYSTLCHFALQSLCDAVGIASPEGVVRDSLKIYFTSNFFYHV
jgi:hypothetical protein